MRGRERFRRWAKARFCRARHLSKCVTRTAGTLRPPFDPASRPRGGRGDDRAARLRARMRLHRGTGLLFRQAVPGGRCRPRDRATERGQARGVTLRFTSPLSLSSRPTRPQAIERGTICRCERVAPLLFGEVSDQAGKTDGKRTKPRILLKKQKNVVRRGFIVRKASAFAELPRQEFERLITHDIFGSGNQLLSLMTS